MNCTDVVLDDVLGFSDTELVACRRESVSAGTALARLGGTRPRLLSPARRVEWASLIEQVARRAA